MKVPHWFLAPIIHAVYRLWCGTLRITESGRKALDDLDRQGKPTVVSLWHNEFFPLMAVRRALRVVIVVSQSNDGEYAARLLEALGLKTARGSSRRGGLAALLHAARMMRSEHYHGCITLDGPTGPRHQVKEGAVFLAVRTPAPIVPARIFMKRAIVFNSWDRYQLPLPFSRVHIAFGEPYLPEARELTAEALRDECARLRQKLDALCPPDSDWPDYG